MNILHDPARRGNDTTSYEAVAAKLRAAGLPESIICDVAEDLTAKPYEATGNGAGVLVADDRTYRFALHDWLRQGQGEHLVILPPDFTAPGATIRVASRAGDAATVQEWAPPPEERDVLRIFSRERFFWWPDMFFRSVGAMIRREPERARSCGWERPVTHTPEPKPIWA